MKQFRNRSQIEALLPSSFQKQFRCWQHSHFISTLDQKGQTNEMPHMVFNFCTIRIIHCHILNNNSNSNACLLF